MNNLVSRIAQAVFGVVMIIFSINHFRMGSGMAGYVPAYFPAQTLFVYITGAGLALAGISFILNIKVKLVGYLLGLMLLIIGTTVHLLPFINSVDADMHYGNFLKDYGLAAAAFFIGSKGK